MSMMPVISLWNPWAIWVGLGWKTIETRLHDKYASLCGKRIGIHAALKWDDTAMDAARPYLTEYQYLASKDFLKVGGAIICTVRVRGVDWLSNSDSKSALIDCGSVRRFGLFLDDVQTIPMIGCKGKQGIWYYEIPDPPPARA